MTSLSKSVVRIEKSREAGVTKYLNRARISMFKALGMETRDVLEVIDVNQGDMK